MPHRCRNRKQRRLGFNRFVRCIPRHVTWVQPFVGTENGNVGTTTENRRAVPGAPSCMPCNLLRQYVLRWEWCATLAERCWGFLGLFAHTAEQQSWRLKLVLGPLLFPFKPGGFTAITPICLRPFVGSARWRGRFDPNTLTASAFWRWTSQIIWNPSGKLVAWRTVHRSN